MLMIRFSSGWRSKSSGILRYGTGAGLYSSLHGPLPWVINKLPSPRYYAARIR
jgi:hypothetical protein